MVAGNHQRWLAENRVVSVVFLKLPTLNSSDFVLAQACMVKVRGGGGAGGELLLLPPLPGSGVHGEGEGRGEEGRLAP